MDKREMILALGNAMIMLDTVSASGEKNWNALLVTKQQIKNVYNSMTKEEEYEAEDKQQSRN